MGKRTETNYLIIHCSATRGNQNITFGCGSPKTTSQGRKTKEFQYINTRKEGGFMVI